MIDWSSPADLDPYAKAHKIESEENDCRDYYSGLYVFHAFETVMAHFSAGFAGKTSKATYLKEPFSQMVKNEKKKLNKNKETHEEVAVFEMKKRIKMLEQSGLPQSPD